VEFERVSAADPPSERRGRERVDERGDRQRLPRPELRRGGDVSTG
jgi:hypothetical protein